MNTMFAQMDRSLRLSLQYQSWQNLDINKKDSFNLLAANAFLNEGNYQSAISINDKIKEAALNKNMKLFISGKAEFLHDNYEGSLSFFDALDHSTISKELVIESQLIRTMDQIHLLEQKKAADEYLAMILKGGGDTANILAEFMEVPLPQQFDLKKARRRSRWLPGSGLYYVGEKRKAVGSFFVNALFLGYAGYSVYNQHYITAVLTGAAQFMRFYNGGQRATTKFGYKKNREKYLDYVMKVDKLVQKKYFELTK